MSYLNISPIDKQGLSSEDKKKLTDYDMILDFTTLKKGDHFRYTSNKYKESGRKLAYGVVHEINHATEIMEVNGYTNSDDDIKFDNWDIDINNPYKKYVLYTKVRNNKF